MLNDANRNECSCKDDRSHYSTDVSLVQFYNDLELSINKNNVLKIIHLETDSIAPP